MSTKPWKRQLRENLSTVAVPSEQWSGFLDDFSRQRRGWSACLETYDWDTRENVLSPEGPLVNTETTVHFRDPQGTV